VACVNIRQLESGEKPSDDRKSLIGYISALCASNKQGWFFEPYFVGILEGEISQIVERRPKSSYRDPEFLDFLVHWTV
jgi:hypothetical protein